MVATRGRLKLQQLKKGLSSTWWKLSWLQIYPGKTGQSENARVFGYCCQIKGSCKQPTSASHTKGIQQAASEYRGATERKESRSNCERNNRRNWSVCRECPVAAARRFCRSRQLPATASQYRVSGGSQ